jgi:hypothetical protein
MACTDRAGFRDALAAPCTTWTSPQCQAAAARSLGVHGTGCLRYPLFDLGSAPPLASYVRSPARILFAVARGARGECDIPSTRKCRGQLGGTVHTIIRSRGESTGLVTPEILQSALS